MADISFLKNQFAGGYSSGDILGVKKADDEETRIRLLEEKKIGGSYIDFFNKGVRPHLAPRSRILELGPGKGSWTRALFEAVHDGEIHTIDIQDVRPWLADLLEHDNNRIFVHQTPANNEAEFFFLQNNYFDIFFSFGVFCHLNPEDMESMLMKIRPKLKKDAVCIIQFSDWKKGLEFIRSPENLEVLWKEYAELSETFPYEIKMLRNKSLLKKCGLMLEKYILKKYRVAEDKQKNFLWTRNDQAAMLKLFKKTGYDVIEIDMDFFKRDSVSLVRPAAR